MSDLAVIKAEFTDYRPVKTRKVLQLVFEVPAEQQDLVFKALGYPMLGESRWVAIAKLVDAPKRVEGNGPDNNAAMLVTPSAPAQGQGKPERTYTRSQIAALKIRDPEFQR